MSSLTIGNFDGVHLGHRSLVERARARASDGRVLAVTFEPHPAAVLEARRAPRRLTPAPLRRALLESLGVDEVIELEPTAELLALDGADFIEFLRGRHAFDTVVEGADFRFGRGRSCGIDELESIGDRLGFGVEVVDDVSVTLEDRTILDVRSTAIRWLLTQGRVVDAAIALGRAHQLQSTVVKGDQRGRDLGFPTANLEPNDTLLPADGVYAGIATLPDGARVPAAISVGTKPTFGPNQRVCEAHLIDHDAPLDEYGWPLQLEFTRYLHQQFAYAGVEPLIDRIRRDCDDARLHAPRGMLSR
ncbi:MAG: bifunctional riboflavin kinase/FMN adenylyltransferase [Planctomycetota bacterium]|nr:bifunctional riboflavin kinase/FMN adenylyltransferase [Planctomycetota bacterium]